jgi:metal-responsive CopG/Arc/MetJ family transcriptional regulator
MEFMATMKTAISIQEPLLKEVEVLAEKMQISRSRVFVLAVQEYIRQVQNQEMLKNINRVYLTEPDPREKVLADRKKSYHRRMVEGEW